MTSREAILSKIRAQLADRRDRASRLAAVEERISARARHPQPSRVTGRNQEELVSLFRAYMEGQSATVLDVPSRQAIPAAIADYLRANNLPPRIRVGGDALLTQAPWGSQPHLEVLLGRAQPGDDVGLTHALAAVAETGTLVLASGPDNPVTLNFMPETHLVVVDGRDVVAAYEDAWDRVRTRCRPQPLPRTVNLISGPSRTGDIGGRLVMGAHGPRRMCVIIVREADAAA